MSEKACRNCRYLTTADICPNCKRTGLSREWVGELVVVDPDKSELAKKMGITKPGRYALRVR